MSFVDIEILALVCQVQNDSGPRAANNFESTDAFETSFENPDANAWSGKD